MAKPTDTDLMRPLDLSDLCDGQRTDFPLDIKVDTARVMLNGNVLLERTDYLIGNTPNGESKLELKRAPKPGDQLVVTRVPAEGEARAA